MIALNSILCKETRTFINEKTIAPKGRYANIVHDLKKYIIPHLNYTITSYIRQAFWDVLPNKSPARNGVYSQIASLFYKFLFANLIHFGLIEILSKLFWQEQTILITQKRDCCRIATVSLTLEQVTGIEPACSAWEADILPMNYTCIVFSIAFQPKMSRWFT